MTGYASATEHARYVEPIPPDIMRRRRCTWSCGGKITHFGMANGFALCAGCEFHMRMWKRGGYPELHAAARRLRKMNVVGGVP